MKIAIFGSSGHARETADICHALGYSDILFIDRQSGRDAISAIEIVSEESVFQLAKSGYSFSIGIGSGKVRRSVAEKFPNLSYANLIHPAATCGMKQQERFAAKKGNIVAAGARLTNNIEVGNFGCYNINSVVHHDCIIGDYVTISPGANIAGNVCIGDNAFIGIGATIIDGQSINRKLLIGQNALVAAGAVVVSDVPAGKTVKGVPAK